MTMTMSERGRLGGKACARKHGRDHYRAIGKVGYRTTLTRWWQGDVRGFHAWLAAQGWEVMIDRLVDLDLDRQLAAGAAIACIELPVVLDDDDDLPF